MSDRTRGAYARWAATYDTDPNPQTALEYDAVLAAVAARPGVRILDAACGTARYLAEFHRAGAVAVGLDFSAAMLRRARAKVPAASLCLADLAGRLPFRDATFGTVCCAQTLKHLSDLGPAIDEFARVLVPGGCLVFRVTHPEMTWDGYEMRLTPAFILSEQADIHHHPWASYEAALVGAGFNPIEPRALRVSSRIAEFLTPESLAIVRGRPQVLLCTARRARAVGT